LDKHKGFISNVDAGLLRRETWEGNGTKAFNQAAAAATKASKNPKEKETFTRRFTR
jgi:hypothetical protein